MGFPYFDNILDAVGWFKERKEENRQAEEFRAWYGERLEAYLRLKNDAPKPGDWKLYTELKEYRVAKLEVEANLIIMSEKPSQLFKAQRIGYEVQGLKVDELVLDAELEEHHLTKPEKPV